MKKSLVGSSFKVLSFVASALVVVLLIVGLLGNAHLISYANASTSTSTTETINLTVNQVITLTTSSTINLPNLTPGTPVYATTSAVVTTNAAAGWQLDINRAAASSTSIASGTITFPDALPTFSGSNATSAANLSSAGQELSFRGYASGTSAGIYSTSTWGTDDQTANALWGGIPTSTIVTMSTSSYTGTAQTVEFGIRANAPATQQATTYTGVITITAIALP
jgi:hypothetical protein